MLTTIAAYMRRADPWLHEVIQANIKLLRTSPWTTPQPEAAHDRMASRCQKPHVLKVCRCPRLVARSKTTNTVKIIRTMPHANMMATFAYKLRAETGVCKNTREKTAQKATHIRIDLSCHRPHHGPHAQKGMHALLGLPSP